MVDATDRRFNPRNSCGRRVSPGSPGRTPSIEQFQAEIQKALEGRLRELTDASVIPSSIGYRVYRIIGRGVASQDKDREVPVQWTYYYVGDKEGRQVVLAVHNRCLEQVHLERRAVENARLVLDVEVEIGGAVELRMET